MELQTALLNAHLNPHYSHLLENSRQILYFSSECITTENSSIQTKYTKTGSTIASRVYYVIYDQDVDGETQSSKQ